jgi:UDP-N-acetylglucosamine acyltransferase
MAKTNISPQSIIEKGAKLARDVVGGPFCYIGSGVKIGRGCIIENNVTIVGKTTLGEQNHIYPMAVIGATLNGDETNGVCNLGSANNLREHATVYAGSASEPTCIGKDNLIMIACQVGPGTQVGDHCIFANCTHIAGQAIIEDYVRTSAFSFVDHKVRLGAYTFTAGYVQVDHDAPPFAMIQGSPYRVRGVNSHNLKQCGFGEQDIRSLKRAFRELFNGSGEMKMDTLDELASDDQTNQYVKTLVKYLQATAASEADNG